MLNFLNFTLNKIQLYWVSSCIGAVGGIAIALGQYEVIPPKTGNLIGAICGVLVSHMVQMPARERPNTEDLEEAMSAGSENTDTKDYGDGV